MKKEKGEGRTRVSNRLLELLELLVPKNHQQRRFLYEYLQRRSEDPMVEGSESKHGSPKSSKKKGRNGHPKEETVVKKKSRIKSLVAKRKFVRPTREEEKE
ncbi:hypothetical protein CSA_023375 [Cucumis sativus]|uniref:Uncharacterized protein n=1 Tax=Cucumis sativus TaxID=3659 RepID=A0ACB6HBU3_CUCSA|nr:hypothetical protein CSA_023375 [Cucumis sativus]